MHNKEDRKELKVVAEAEKGLTEEEKQEILKEFERKMVSGQKSSSEYDLNFTGIDFWDLLGD